MTKMEKACTIGKPLIYFNSDTQTWWACYDSRYHKDGSFTVTCDILDVLNKGRDL